jgi:hypothetical protein
MRPKLSYANVMATVAAFLALGGGAIAASNLGKNSVGAKQLKKNAVTTAKVKNQAITAAKVKKGTLTGSNINMNQLGTVPSASHATTAEIANSLAPAEPFHMVGEPGQVPFEHGAQNYSGLPPFQFQKAGFYKDHEGVVHLKGSVKAGKGGGVKVFTPIFKLPPGYRPTPNTESVFVGGATQVLIAGGGTTLEGVNVEGAVLASEENYVLLDGITFRAES